MISNKLLNLGIAIVALLLIFVIYKSAPDLKVALIPYYYRYLDKEAGVISYEKEYHDAFTKAEELRVQSNTLLDKTAQGVNDSHGMSASQFYETFFQKQTALLGDREQYIERMIEIDMTALDLEKNGPYRTFYEKRSASDYTEQEAFKEYKKASMLLAKGNVVYKLSDIYTSYMDYVVKEGLQKITKDNIYDLNTQLIKIESFYTSEVEPEIQNKTFSQEMNAWFGGRLNDMRLMTKFHEERVKGNDDKASEILADALASMSKSTEFSSTEYFLAWSKTNVQPHYAKQQQLHVKSSAQYTEAYAYAKAHKLSAILNVWNNIIPGFEKKI